MRIEYHGAFTRFFWRDANGVDHAGSLYGTWMEDELSGFLVTCNLDAAPIEEARRLRVV